MPIPNIIKIRPTYKCIKVLIISYLIYLFDFECLKLFHILNPVSLNLKAQVFSTHKAPSNILR